MAFHLLPRDDTFFTLFERAAANTLAGAEALAELCRNYERVEEKVRHIKDLEHKGDHITHETLDRLNSTFITPLDREDIHRLVSGIDDVLDHIDATANRLYLYEIDRPTDEMKTMVEVLVRSCVEVQTTVGYLRDLRRAEEINRHCIEINRLENECDDLLRLALKRLLHDHSQNAIAVIKWKEIYEKVESASDRCEDVANAVQAILLKNA